MHTQTGPFGSQLHSYDYVPEGVPVIPTEAIGKRRLHTEGIPQVLEETAARLSRHRLKPGDILFARRGVQATGLAAIVGEEQEGWLCGTGAILLRVLTAEIDQEFLSFHLSSDESIQWLKQHAVGAVMPNLNEGVIRRLPLRLPPFAEQKRIAHILGTLDEKIELNRRMNSTLEMMAGALFQNSFVDEIAEALPTGWSEGTVDELASFSRGTLSPAKFPDEIFAHYSLPAFDNGRIPSGDPGSQIKSNKTLVPNNSVLISKLNPRIPRIWLPSISETHRAISSTEFLVVVPKKGVTREFLFCLFGNESFMNTLAAMVTGTSGSHQRIKPDSLLSMSSVIPSKAAIQKFSEAVGPMLQKIQSNIDQSKTLAAIRDTLLPKLLSDRNSVEIKNLEYA